MLKATAIAIMTVWLSQPTLHALDPPKVLAKLTYDELLDSDLFNGLPFIARDEILLAKFQHYKSMPWREAVKILKAAEDKVAARRNLKGLSPFPWSADASYADQWSENGRRFRSIEVKGRLTLVATALRIDKYLAIDILISCPADSPTSILVSPANVSVIGAGGAAEILKGVTGDDIARKISRGARWRTAFAEAGANSATTTIESSENGAVNGSATGPNGTVYASGQYSGTTRTRVPDYEARRRILENAQAIREQASRKIAALTNEILLENTVRPGQTVTGRLYLEPPKKGTSEVIFQLIVGTVSFEFPLPIQ